jgi:hypothetical protein
MAITKPPITTPFATNPTTQADGDLFAAPSFMVDGYTAPGGNPEIPALGHFNWLFWFAMQSARYHQSIGIPEWDAAETEYVAGSVVLFSGDWYFLFGTATLALDPSADPGNWMPFANRGPWGYSATSTTIGADTDLTGGHQYYRNLTIAAGKKLNIVDPGILFVSGTLTFGDAASRLYFGKPSDLAGANGAASNGGLGGVGWNDKAFGAMCGGGSGGRGGYDPTFTPGVGGAAGGIAPGGTVNTNFMNAGLGGTGGAGGAGVHAAGANGVFSDYFSGSPTWDTQTQSLLKILLQHGFGFARGQFPATRGVATAFGVEGGSGGGGGGGPTGPGNSAGGGGGAGGAVGIVIAKNVVIVADGNIQAPGGAGGNGFGGSVAAGGGGGGGGGFVGLIYGQKTGPALTAAVCCPGGAAGTGANGGATGTAGSVGNVREYQIGI